MDSFSRENQRKRLSSLEIFHFFEQMRALIGAGITPQGALEVMGRDTGNARITALTAALSDAIGEGMAFSEAVSASGAFPDYVTALLSLGEEVGHLEQVCASLSRYYEDDAELKSAIRSAVTYPVIMIAMMFAVVIVLLSKVMPVFAQVFEQLGTSVTGLTRTLIQLSSLLSRSVAVLVVLFLLAVLLFLYLTMTERGRLHAQRFLQRFPLTRRFTEDMALTRFTGAFQMACAAGMDPREGLSLTASLVENDAVEQRIRLCRDRLDEGDRFSEAVAASGLFTGFYAGLISVFDEAGGTGGIDEAMDFISRRYKEETDQRISRLLSSIEPTMVAVLSVLVGGILLSVILPLMGIMSNIG